MEHEKNPAAVALGTSKNPAALALGRLKNPAAVALGRLGGKARGVGLRNGTIPLSGCAKFKADVPRCPCGGSTLKRAISRCFDCCRKAGIENPEEQAQEWH